VHEFLSTQTFTDESIVAFSAAVREAMTNAARHGNGGDPSRRIRIRCLVLAECVEVPVEDEGAGFDHRSRVKSGLTRDAILAERERGPRGARAGLGIPLMIRCCDRLEYNEQGNRITLTKALDPHR
jgi:anti-sigma regulatory factor (Ser/Thr protein kinase)